MKKVLFRIFFYLFASAFFAIVFGFAFLSTMDILIKGKEIKTPDFLNLSLKEARQKAYKKNIRLKELLLNSEFSKPEIVISQFPQSGNLIKESGNRVIKIFYTPKKSEVIMPDLSGLSIIESKSLLQESRLKWSYSFVYSETAPIDFVVSQTFIAGTKLKKGSRVGILISKGKQRDSFIMPELIGKNADSVLSFFENKGIKVLNIAYKTYEGLGQGIIINQTPRQGYKINNRSIINLEVSD